DTMEDVSKYYYHGVSHFLGLDTHDVGSRKVILEEGMVLTVEPGLYIEDEAIGIRIEDDILVTATGAENLSEAIIKTVEDIEAFMA
ncbi:MAG: M24 family metallopeptidase, partial [Niameybacter sp.]